MRINNINTEQSFEAKGFRNGIRRVIYTQALSSGERVKTTEFYKKGKLFGKGRLVGKLDQYEEGKVNGWKTLKSGRKAEYFSIMDLPHEVLLTDRLGIATSSFVRSGKRASVIPSKAEIDKAIQDENLCRYIFSEPDILEKFKRSLQNKFKFGK